LDDLPRYSEAFKRKMVARLTGPNGMSARKLAKETGLKQQTLSLWLEQARSLPFVADKRTRPRHRTVAEKARILVAVSELPGDEMLAYLEREGISVAELEQWRMSLEEGGMADAVASRRIRALERELVRKEKALAETAALLVLKKKVYDLFPVDEDDESDEPSEK